MQSKAAALIAILRDALYVVEEDSKPFPNDPVTIELKNSILRGIAELERVEARSDHSKAA